MKRNITAKINTITEAGLSRPLLLCGPKGVGKTYTLLEAAAKTKKEILYINFETDGEAREYFNQYYDGISEVLSSDIDEDDAPQIIYNALSSFFGIDLSLVPEFIFVLDEIGFCKGAEALLSYGAEGDVYCAASNAISHYEAFECLRMHPMTFDEFLLATNHEWYRDVITAHFENFRHVPDIIHNDLADLFDIYLELGGMPEVIAEYVRNDNLYNVSSLQASIYTVNTYLYDKILAPGEALKIRQISELICSPADTKKDYKFKYANLRKGATYNIYSLALNEMFLSKSVLPCYKAEIVTDEGHMDFKKDSDSFRAYYFDTGLLRMSYKNKGVKNDDESEYRLNLLENCLMQHLSASNHEVFYWESGAKARIDFVIRNEAGIIPIEIRTEEQKKQKSMNVFKNRFDIPYSIRFFSDNFEKKDDVRFIPYYAMFCI